MDESAYAKFMADRNIIEYTIDGAINPVIWKQSAFRLLFLLKENYGYQGCKVFKTADEVHGWLRANIKTYKKIAELSAAIHEAIKIDRPLTDAELCRIGQDRERLESALDQIATVNIKKHSGQSKSNDREIRMESRANAVLLTQQIADLAPHAIIVGGGVCWHSLILDMKLFDEMPECANGSAIVHEGVIVCHANHPAAWRGEGFPVGTLHRAIWQARVELRKHQGQ